MIFFLGSIFHSLPSNVVSDTGVRSPIRTFSVDLAPQGWGFFTRSPSELDLLFYDAQSLEPLMVTPQGRPENLLGLSRTQRAQGPEAGNLLRPLSDEDWQSCEAGDVLETCIGRLENSAIDPPVVTNSSPVKTLCGEVIFAQSDPVPWSYRDLYDVQHLPQHVTKLDIECDE
ncbi:SdpA family antimicrobial peptide system protein [Georgenia yuyongxinii]